MCHYEKNTLLIKHLPNELSNDEKVDFLKFFGAIDVKCLSPKNTKCSFVFAKFPSEREAGSVLKKLHQTVLFNQLISVEYSRGSDNDRYFPPQKDRRDEVKEEQTSQRKHLDNFIQRLNSWSNHLDFDEPPPVHLRYQYPPPTVEVLSNIAKLLAALPRFYTQVLHLMNKMNLPCPFSDNFYIESDIVKENFTDHLKKKEKISKLSEEESELESEVEEKLVEKDMVPVKRKRSGTKLKVKRPKLLAKPTLRTDKSKVMLKPDQVFETELMEISKKIEVKLSTDLKTLEETREEIAGEGFEKLSSSVELKETEQQEKHAVQEERGVISAEELALNRVPTKDQHVLPVYKNYQPGVPSCRLYIKNLAKTVTIVDLNYIFKRYLIDAHEEQGSMFDVQVLQEGRMKGQAFVSLQTVELAKRALSETNGYILKGKPMVVQYARSSKPKS